jgi:hypothetical protein
MKKLSVGLNLQTASGLTILLVSQLKRLALAVPRGKVPCARPAKRVSENCTRFSSNQLPSLISIYSTRVPHSRLFSSSLNMASKPAEDKKATVCMVTSAICCMCCPQKAKHHCGTRFFSIYCKKVPFLAFFS